ncbi:hypothetical protein UT300012_23150 [Paraclostridium bifermentans]
MDNKRESTNLVILVYFLFCLSLVVVVRFGAKFVHPLVAIGLMLAVQQLYVIPRLFRMFFKLRGYEQYGRRFTRFIPVWNEVEILDNALGTIYLITSILFVIALGCVFVEPSMVAKFLPQSVALGINNTAIYAAILIGVVLCVCRGFGYWGLMNDINKYNEEFVGYVPGGDKWSFVDWLPYVTYFVPVIRCIGMLYQVEKLVKMTELNEFRIEELDYDDFE